MAANVGLVLITAGTFASSRLSLPALPNSFWIILLSAAGLIAIGISFPGSRELLHLAPASWNASLLPIATGLGMVLLPALVPGPWLPRQAKLS